MYWLRRLFHKSQTERELDSELRFHLERRAADLASSGVSTEESRRQAQLEFGGTEAIKEECRESRSVHFFETLLQDIRYGVRVLRRTPAFTCAAILTVALGAGATTAVFSVVNAILLKPLAYPDAKKIVFPWRKVPGLNVGYDEFPWGRLDFQIMAQNTRAFQAVSAFQSDSFNLTGSGEPTLLHGIRASSDFFPVLGVSPALGRAYTSEEDRPGHENEVILSDALWRERFAADPGIVGRSLNLNGISYTVIGVMPPGFSFPRAEEMPAGFTFAAEPQLWVPLALRSGPRQLDETSDLLAVIARLRPGVSMKEAQAEMDVFARRREHDSGVQGVGWFDSKITLISRQVVGNTRRPLLLLLGAVGIVLLIACANVATLLLIRSLRRSREFVLRTALGASGARLVRQLVTESLTLAFAGNALGVVLAMGAIRLIKLFAPSNIPRLHGLEMDWTVLLFSLGITLVTGVLFGLAPAAAAIKTNLIEALKDAGQRLSGNIREHRLRDALLVGEIALALVLTVSAGLLGRSFFHLLGAESGFNAEKVLTFQLSLPASRYSTQADMATLYHRVLQQLQSLPEVQSAGIVETMPLDGTTESTGIRIPGWPRPKPGTTGPFANYTIASPGYFSAVGTPVLRGRSFLETDTADSPPVVIINSAMARKYWPGTDPLGKQMGLGSPRFPIMTIVGIVADVKHISLREQPGPEMYVPYTQKPYPSMLIMQAVLRTKADPASAAESARRAVHSVDPDLPVAGITPLTAIVDRSVAQPRFAMLLLGAFGSLALLLASVGMYGVVSYSVAQRTREIGIRMALGAKRGAVFAMVLRQGGRLAVIGLMIGFAGTLAVSRAIAGVLYGVKPTDPATFTAVAALLGAISLAACLLPARRAMRVDPMIALRDE